MKNKKKTYDITNYNGNIVRYIKRAHKIILMEYFKELFNT